MSSIVVGYDRSPGAESALRFALRESAMRRLSIRVVHAWQVAPYATAAAWAVAPFPPLIADQIAVHRRATLEGLQRDVREIRQEEDAGEVTLVVETVEGPPAQALVDAAEGADLLVVGTRGHGGFAGLLLGSVSQACAHHSPCPLVIVPPDRTRTTSRRREAQALHGV